MHGVELFKVYIELLASIVKVLGHVFLQGAAVRTVREVVVHQLLQRFEGQLAFWLLSWDDVRVPALELVLDIVPNFLFTFIGRLLVLVKQGIHQPIATFRIVKLAILLTQSGFDLLFRGRGLGNSIKINLLILFFHGGNVILVEVFRNHDRFTCHIVIPLRSCHKDLLHLHSLRESGIAVRVTLHIGDLCPNGLTHLLFSLLLESGRDQGLGDVFEFFGRQVHSAVFQHHRVEIRLVRE